MSPNSHFLRMARDKPLLLWGPFKYTWAGRGLLPMLPKSSMIKQWTNHDPLKGWVHTAHLGTVLLCLWVTVHMHKP